MSTNSGTKDIRSHAVPDLSETTTAYPKSDVTDTASSKVPSTFDYASIPLKSSAKTVDYESGDTVGEQPATTATGGGVTGFIRSILGGGGQKEEPKTESAVQTTDAAPQTTFETKLKGGTEAQVATAPGHTAVPETLRQSPSPVGTAKTTFEEPVSEFAPALSSIAGEPEASDPTKKYGHALDALTGESPVASSSPGYISSAVQYATDTVKHAVGLDNSTPTSPSGATTNANPVGSETGTGVTSGVKSSPGTLTVDDLPKGGRIHPHEDGSIDVGKGGTSSLAARQAAGTAPTASGPTKTPVVFEEDDTEVITPKDLPKSGTVETSKDGSADIKETQTPGLLAAAVGTVLGGAEYVKETVSHLVTGDQAGDTSEQIKALDSKNGVPPPSAAPVTTPSTLNEAGAAKPKVEFEDSEPIAAPVKDTASSSVVVPPTSSATKEPISTSATTGASNLSNGTSASALPLTSAVPTTNSAAPSTGSASGFAVPTTGSASISVAPTIGSAQPTTASSASPVAKTEPVTATRAVPVESSVPTTSSVPKTVEPVAKTDAPSKVDNPTPTSRSVEAAAAPAAGAGATAASLGQKLAGETEFTKPTSTSSPDTKVATADSTPATAGTTPNTATKSGVSSVKEVDPTPSNGVTESSKAGKETVKLPTREVVSATPGSTNTKSSAPPTSSQPVVSAFATPSTSATGTKAADAPKGTSSSTAEKGTAEKATPLDKGKEVATPASTSAAPASTAAGSAVAQEVKPASAGTAAATKPASSAPKTAAKQKEEKKSGGACGCCVIS